MTLSPFESRLRLLEQQMELLILFNRLAHTINEQFLLLKVAWAPHLPLSEENAQKLAALEGELQDLRGKISVALMRGMSDPEAGS